MIRLDDVSFRYPDAATPVLHGIEMDVAEGELCLVVGQTGSGKSTLLQLVNGLAPHFTGGVLGGTVTVAGRDTRTHPPRDLADLIGVVGQDPLAGFVTSTVDDELAYGMEQLGTPDAVMRTRVEEVVDLLGIADLRTRTLAGLSGGQQQRVAIGSVLTSHPRVLVLDEPTSALDPTAAEEVLAIIVRLVHDLGITVLLAEHRLERVVQYADSMIQIHPDGTATHGSPAEILAAAPDAPPIVELGRLAGWSPLPLSVRDARRQAEPLRARLRESYLSPRSKPARVDVVATVHDLRVQYNSVLALDDVQLRLHRGEVAVVMGRNGSGKSSLLWALQGSGKRSGGTVALTVADGNAGSAGHPHAVDPAGSTPVTRRGSSRSFRRHQPTCSTSEPSRPSAPRPIDRRRPRWDRGGAPGAARAGCRAGTASPRPVGGPTAGARAGCPACGLPRHPASRRADARPRLFRKRRLCAVVKERAEAGTSVLLSTHDVEFAARVADRVSSWRVARSSPTAPRRR